MNILAGLGIAAGVFALTFLFCMLVFCYDTIDDREMIISLVISIVVTIAVVLLSYVGFESSNKAYVEAFNIKKSTIEQSIDSEALSGLERIELVKTAVELNGELANKKVHMKHWYTISSNKDLFENLEYVNLD